MKKGSDVIDVSSTVGFEAQRPRTAKTGLCNPTLGQLLVPSGRQDYWEDSTLPNGGVDTSVKVRHETGEMTAAYGRDDSRT